MSLCNYIEVAEILYTKLETNITLFQVESILVEFIDLESRKKVKKSADNRLKKLGLNIALLTGKLQILAPF